MAYYYKFGRSFSNKGSIDIYMGISLLEEIPDLYVESCIYEVGGESEEELLKTLDYQIEANSLFKTPVAICENFAVTYDEAVQLRKMIKSVPETVSNTRAQAIGEYITSNEESEG